MPHCPKDIFKIFLLSAGIVVSTTAVCQAPEFGLSLPSAPEPVATAEAVPDLVPKFDVASLPAGTFNDDAGGSPSMKSPEHEHGIVYRSVYRTLLDQRDLYAAPFFPYNFKWDAIALGGSALFFVEDHRIENRLPGTHYQLWQDTSNIAIGGLAATLGGVWVYGLKGNHPHALETGQLELETLVNTFLIYTPMQFIAGRQRPGEGNGHGDFFKHRMINTSFPGGHAMFTWAMATVVAHEYSQPWVRVLNYTAAFTVTLSRFMAQDHWASDMWVGTVLGLGIGTEIFHAHCDPDLSSSCRRHYARVAKREAKKSKSKLNYMPFGPGWDSEPVASDQAEGRPISQ